MRAGSQPQVKQKTATAAAAAAIAVLVEGFAVVADNLFNLFLGLTFDSLCLLYVLLQRRWGRFDEARGNRSALPLSMKKSGPLALVVNRAVC